MPAACHFYDLPAFALPLFKPVKYSGKQRKLFAQLYDFPTHISQQKMV